MTRLALAAALLVLAVAGGTWTGAAFTAGHAEPAATLHAATVALDADHPADQPLRLAALRPGQERDLRLTLHNGGDVAGGLHLRRGPGADLAAGSLASVLHLRLEACRTAACDETDTAWEGTLAELDDVDLGALAAGAGDDFRLRVSWPAAADDPALQGATGALPLEWDLVAGESA